MTERIAIGAKLRFEVFKRDSFTCQYCGSKSPEVILHVDHIDPVSKGGCNEMMNLVTSCASCNFGKGARTLSDNSVVAKQNAQIDEISQRKEQMLLMLEWRNHLKSHDSDMLEVVCNYYKDALSIELQEVHLSAFKKLIKKFDLQVILESIDASIEGYLREEGNWYTQESLHKVFKMLTPICGNKTNGDVYECKKDLFYIRGICKNRFSYWNDSYNQKIITWLEDALENGSSIETLKGIAKQANSWSAFTNQIQALFED